MMKSTFPTIVTFMAVLTLSVYVNGQGSKKVNQWQFPTNCGLDFNTGAPVIVTGGQVNTTEGSSSMADNNGALMFYTDGITVWNKNHVAMPNGFGLLGNSSSSQSAMIVQQPGSANIYYIFTVDEEAGPDGLQYSIVDMTANGGLGNVTSKNNPLITPVCEKLTGCRHSNGSDIWIVTHKFGNNEFYSYLLTSAGLNTVPVITAVGTLNTGSTDEAIGYMKISPNGKKLASAVSRDSNIELFDFDNSTGIPSNPLSLIVSNWTYGVEFSPNSKVLYGSEFVGGIYQWNLSAGSNAAIVASKFFVFDSQSPELGALQLAPDGKIYAARKTLAWLGVINDPDVLGAGCSYLDNGLSLGGLTCYYGLPNMLPSYLRQIDAINFCFGDTTQFNVGDSASYVAVSWNFDDPNSGMLNDAYNYNVSHVFTAPGNYNVQLILVNSMGGSDTLYEPIVISPIPAVNIGNDSTLCIGQVYTMNATTPGGTNYLWNTGSTNASITVSTAGTYTVTVSNGACAGIDSANINFIICAAPAVLFGSSDTSWCEKQAIDFVDFSTNNPTSWQWTFAGALPATSTLQNPTGIFYPSYGTFDVKLVACNGAGCDSLTKSNFVTEYQNPSAPIVTVSNDTMYCSLAVTYAWYNTNNTQQVLSSNSFFYPTQFGSYFVIITDSNGCSTPSATIVYTSLHNVDANAAIVWCSPNPTNGELVTLHTNFDIYTITVYDNCGRIVLSTMAAGKQWVLHTKDWTSGIYHIVVSSGGRSLGTRLQKVD